MNRPSLLHIVERLEGLLGKLPEAIRKPILHELTPLKELFLQQRPPRFLLVGSHKSPILRILEALFPFVPSENVTEDAGRSYWRDFSLGDHGTISILDLRDEDSKSSGARAALAREPADIILFLEEEGADSRTRSAKQNLAELLEVNDKAGPIAKIIDISFQGTKGKRRDGEQKKSSGLAQAGDRFAGAFRFPQPPTHDGAESKALMSILTQSVPNEARIEMIRISRDREAQRDVANILVKSTAAVCTAIGAQPIPLADLPILTTLQLVMVSGIMYLSGRERSLRAATEFMGALGANVGAGMILREGTRALLKFFPGWGNIICGMVAGAGTYAIGRAATVYFLEGASLKDARRVYLKSKKRRALESPEAPKRLQKPAKRRK